MVTYTSGFTSLSPQSNVDTPEGEISAIQSGQIQPLPTYTELDNTTEPLISSVDPTDTRHIPPSYTQDALSESENKAGTSFLITDEVPFAPVVLPERVHVSSSSLIQSWGAPLPENPEDDTEASRERRRIDTVESFFAAIQEGNEEIIDLFLTRNLVTANTTDRWGITPLLTAVETRNMRTVQQLLDAGAEPDAFGIIKGWNHFPRSIYPPHPLIHRTPLQHASSIGHLPLVKLLLESYHCNDALIAPDGQIALRLAAANNHREIVAYLPSRRGGGYLRWKVQHAKSLARAKKAVTKIVRFVRVFVWDIPHFLLWMCPKHMIVKPVVKAWKYCWENKRRFYDACVFEIKAMPGRCGKAARGVWNVIKKIPGGLKKAGEQSVRLAGEAFQAMLRALKKLPAFITKLAKGTATFIADVVKALWKFITVDLPKMITRLSTWIWRLLTIRLPKALAITSKYIWSGILTISTALLNILSKSLSLIHTTLTATLTFFHSLSLHDILHGFTTLLTSIFITLPATIGKWMKGFGEASYKAIGALFGTLGKCVWWVIAGVGWVVVYVPRKVWTVVVSVGESVGKGMHEILVFFRPKA